jgi:hypothetical protein
MGYHFSCLNVLQQQEEREFGAVHSQTVAVSVFISLLMLFYSLQAAQTTGYNGI